MTYHYEDRRIKYTITHITGIIESGHTGKGTYYSRSCLIESQKKQKGLRGLCKYLDLGFKAES